LNPIKTFYNTIIQQNKTTKKTFKRIFEVIFSLVFGQVHPEFLYRNFYIMKLSSLYIGFRDE